MSSPASPEKDIYDWGNYIKNCETIGGLTDAEKTAAKKAIRYLREKLGENFLYRLYNPQSRRPPHPLSFTLLNQVASTRLDLIRYAEVLQALENAQNYNRVFRKFKKPEECEEAISVLDVALEFHRAGFDIEFEPQVFVTNQRNISSKKFPDLRVISRTTRETAIVEVTKLGSSERWNQAVADGSQISFLVFSDLSPADLTMWADMNANFNSTRVEETLELIRQTIQEVKRTGEFTSLKTDCIEVGIASKDKIESLKSWAQERGIAEGISGPPVESNELIRALEKIKGKLSQLPETEPGIIVIPATHSGLFWRTSIEWIVSFLSDKIIDYPKVFCVILTDSSTTGGMDEAYAVSTPEYAYVQRHAKTVTERAVVIFNKAYKGPMSYSLLQQLRRTFLYV